VGGETLLRRIGVKSSGIGVMTQTEQYQFLQRLKIIKPPYRGHLVPGHELSNA